MGDAMNCTDCGYYVKYACPPTNGAEGVCVNPRVDRDVFDVYARNCDGFGFRAVVPETVKDESEQGVRYPCPDCGVDHG
jgi:hypothetical protein